MNTEHSTLLSVVTPAYNRAKLLERCRASLTAQTCMDFEWIVVNDGSSDETGDIMRGITASESPFPIRYIEKENGGKHTALNASHPCIRGKYVLMLDSDDTLTPDAVEAVLTAWEQYEDVPEVGLVTFLKGSDPEHPNCCAPDENKIVPINGYRRIRLRSNDACEVIRAELFRQYPFPVFPGEKFIAEGALWTRVGLTKKCVYINKVIYLCEYLEDGLTSAGRSMRVRNPRGGMFNANLGMGRYNSLRTRWKNGLLFTVYGFFANMTPRQIAAGSDHKAIVRACMPFGRLLYVRWKKHP